MELSRGSVIATVAAKPFSPSSASDALHLVSTRHLAGSSKPEGIVRRSKAPEDTSRVISGGFHRNVHVGAFHT